MTPRAAVTALFFLNGFVFANWLARIPAVASTLQLNSAQVGTALLGMAVGALIAFPMTGSLIARFGSARVTVAYAALYSLAMPLLGLAPGLPWLFAALALFGFGNGGMDVAMNAQGVEVERSLRRHIMNSLHGFFSLGGLVGAATGGLFASAAVAPVAQFGIIAALALLALMATARKLIPDEPSAHATNGKRVPTFALPPRELWGLGLVAICSAIGEGSVGDWSALYLKDSLLTSAGTAALGYAAFSVAMLVGRFGADRVVARFGPARVVRVGAGIAAVGLALGLAVPVPALAMVGFAAVGIGLSVAIPLVYAAAGSHPEILRGLAVAGVATIGYSGFLLGPPLLGWIAEIASLRASLYIVALLCALIVFLPKVDPTHGHR